MASPLAGKAAPRLFISYSHDSREHEDRVRALADRLRQDGIDALIDQYNTAPPDGWPMWTDREIQRVDFVALVCTETYLQRVEGRELPGKGRGVLWEAKLIYNLLNAEDTTVQRFIPILLDGGTEASIPLPLRGLTHYQAETDQGYEDFYRHLTTQPRHEKPALGKLRALPAIEPQSYPASLAARTERTAPTSLDERNRLQMLKRVRLDWIDGVLKQSLYQVARIELGLQTRTDAVERPLKAIVQSPGRLPVDLPAGISIGQVFHDHAEALLILGAPGSGKTTLLLELAESLLNRAELDPNHPIPVVFNLSSWAVRRQPLEKWLVAELNERSDVPKTLAQRWVEAEQVLPLLDGLDEVTAEHRVACVEAVNNFRRDHGLLPIAVCSRIADYEALGVKLRLRTAIVVQPLTRPEIQDYLNRIGAPLQALRAAWERDYSLWELLETPLMLWVAMLAYRNTPVEFSEAGDLEQRRKQLFAHFVTAMFARRSPDTRYTQRQTITWLRWLASGLSRNQQTVFYLEGLSEKWLATRLQRWLLRAGTVFGIGLLLGLLTGSIMQGLTLVISWNESLGLEQHLKEFLVFGAFGSSAGLSLGLVAAFVDLHPVDTIRISLVGMSSRLLRAVRTGLIGGLVSGIIFPLGAELMELNTAPMKWLLLWLIPGLIFGIIYGLMTLLSGESVDTRMMPNQGTLRTIKIALAFGLIYGCIGGSIVGVMVRRSDDWLFGDIQGALLIGFSAGLLCLAVGALASGGLFIVKHFALRLMLWKKHSAPLRFVRFLDYAVERLFLRKVGGGYIFVHRMLVEYFASLPES